MPATKPLANGRDLARAYSPGVAQASIEIQKDPLAASRYTARGNLVAVISNGSTVLDLGNTGTLAAKPVMESKAVLLKKSANIDCFDIEVNERDPKKLSEIICALELIFGAINLELSETPDCFIMEKFVVSAREYPCFTMINAARQLLLERRQPTRFMWPINPLRILKPFQPAAALRESPV